MARIPINGGEGRREKGKELKGGGEQMMGTVMTETARERERERGNLKKKKSALKYNNHVMA